MLQVAQENLENNHYSSSCNRAYYACFYAVNALLYAKALTFSKHSAVIAVFRQHFVKTGEFDSKWSKIYQVVMNSHQMSDYDLNLSISKEQAENILTDAKNFVKEVEIWLTNHNLL